MCVAILKALTKQLYHSISCELKSLKVTFSPAVMRKSLKKGRENLLIAKLFSKANTRYVLLVISFHIIKFDVFHRIGTRKWGKFNELHVMIFAAIKKQQELDGIPCEALNSVNNVTLDLIAKTSSSDRRIDKGECKGWKDLRLKFFFGKKSVNEIVLGAFWYLI